MFPGSLLYAWSVPCCCLCPTEGRSLSSGSIDIVQFHFPSTIFYSRLHSARGIYSLFTLQLVFLFCVDNCAFYLSFVLFMLLAGCFTMHRDAFKLFC